MKYIILIYVIFITNYSIAKDWSQYITSQRKNDVSFSFRQKKTSNHSWSVQWRVENNRKSWVEPVILQRIYICKNKQTRKHGEYSFGFFEPHLTQENQITDTNICPNSQLVAIEIQTEIRQPPSKVLPK